MNHGRRLAASAFFNSLLGESAAVAKDGARHRPRHDQARNTGIKARRLAGIMKGKALERGLKHFRKEGAKLVPEPTAPDPYIDEAYRQWAIKQQSK